MRKPSATAGRGPIQADAIYPLNTFLKRLGIGRHSLTAMRRRGLKIRMIGTRAFVDGNEFLQKIRELWQQEDGELSK